MGDGPGAHRGLAVSPELTISPEGREARAKCPRRKRPCARCPGHGQSLPGEAPVPPGEIRQLNQVSAAQQEMGGAAGCDRTSTMQVRTRCAGPELAKNTAPRWPQSRTGRTPRSG